MCNATWACYDCRLSVRRELHRDAAVPCPRCGAACVFLGSKIRIPPQGDARAWRGLRTFLRESRLAEFQRSTRVRTNERHEVERYIALLESRPANPDRMRVIASMKGHLARL